MPISLERKHDYDCLFFVLLKIFVIQTVCFNVNNATVFIFPMLYRVFSQAISLSLENGYIYFSGGGGSTKGEKLLYNIGRLVYKKYFCVTLDQ